MRKIESGIPVLVLIVMISSTIAGCLGTESGTGKEEDGPKIVTDTFELEGQVETLAQASPNTVTEEIHFEIPHSQITRIRINVSIEDGDENTGTDRIDRIRMWRESGGDPVGAKEDNGGVTPYSTSIEFEYKGDETEVDWWIVEITATCEAGEDTWIGPFIWQGVPDHGVLFQIEADYDYVPDQMEESSTSW